MKKWIIGFVLIAMIAGESCVVREHGRGRRIEPPPTPPGLRR